MYTVILTAMPPASLASKCCHSAHKMQKDRAVRRCSEMFKAS